MKNQDPFFNAYQAYIGKHPEFASEFSAKPTNAKLRAQFQTHHLQGFQIIHDLAGGYVSISKPFNALTQTEIDKGSSLVGGDLFFVRKTKNKLGFRITNIPKIDKTQPLESQVIDGIFAKILSAVKVIKAGIY